ncbi:hypothetical protein D9M68_811120 [compost metagenome]
MDRFLDGSSGAGWGNIDHRGIGAGALLAFGHRSKDRKLRPIHAGGPGLATLLGVGATDHLGAEVSQRMLGMKRAGLAGQALYENAGVFVDEDRHLFLFRRLGARRRPPAWGKAPLN